MLRAVLFIDIQAAYYEASRRLVFGGDELDPPAEGLCGSHLGPLAHELLRSGALELMGVPIEERSLLQDCVECSHWRLVTSDRTFAATAGRDLAMASQMLYLVRFSRLRYGTSNGSAPQKVWHITHLPLLLVDLRSCFS